MLSVVIVTKNEENNIERCIRSVIDIANEFLIIDSGSTDKTVQIAERLGATVVFNEWVDYPPQVQFGINLAKGDYILVLDLRASIKASIEEQSFDCYQFNRRTYYLGKFLNYTWTPEWKKRLFKKGSCKYEGELHERVVCEGKVGKLNGELHHYSYKGFEDQLLRTLRYAKKSADIMSRSGKKFKVVNLLVNPAWEFVKVFLNKGFLDGYRGLIVATFSCMHTFLKYAFLLEIELKKKFGEDIWR
jgi:glycosyltransferase involved in cell wall biosynthesis